MLTLQEENFIQSEYDRVHGVASWKKLNMEQRDACREGFEEAKKHILKYNNEKPPSATARFATEDKAARRRFKEKLGVL